MMSPWQRPENGTSETLRFGRLAWVKRIFGCDAWVSPNRMAVRPGTYTLSPAGRRDGVERMRWKYVPPALYLAFALYAWVDFTRTAHDGWGALGLVLATLPIAAIGVVLTQALGQTGFVLIPSGLGYYTAHAVYFWPSALLIAALLYGLCSWFSRLLAARHR